MGYRAKRDFSTEETQMALKHLKTCSASLVIWEMQIKTTLRFHITPVIMTKMKKSRDSRGGRGYREKGTLLHYWWDCKLVKAL